MEQIGRGGWFALGIAGLVVAGVAHAVTGAAHIGSEMLRPEPDEGPGPASAGVCERVDSGPGGWILFGGLVLAGGAVYHVIAGVAEILRDLVRARPTVQSV
ncbi:succinate dehydrogenase/fumarate reductase cytochrome b subunit [Streptacidiphilus sp. EB129]